MPTNHETELPSGVVRGWEDVHKTWDYIVRNYQTGESILTEKEFARKIGINNLRIREALRTLQLLGLIKRQQGVGTYRSEPDPRLMSKLLSFYLTESLGNRPQDPLKDPLRCLRAAVEADLAEQAAHNWVGGDLTPIHDAIELQANQRDDLTQWVAADRLFHLAVMRAAHDDQLSMWTKIIVDAFAAYEVPTNVCEEPRATNILQEHWDLLNFIEKRNGEEARTTMRKHIRWPHERRPSNRKPRQPRSR